MANIALIITAVIIILFVLSFIKRLIFSKTRNIFMIMFSLFILVILIVSGITIYDLTNFSEQFPTSPKLFLLNDQGTILTAVVINDITDPEGVVLPSTDYISQVKDLLIKNDLTSVLNQHWRVFVVNSNAFDNIDQPFGQDTTSKPITKDKALELLRSDDSQELIALMPNTKPQEAKAKLFHLLLGLAFEKDPLFLINQYKANNLVIFPKTVFFKSLDIIPKQLVSGLIEEKFKKPQVKEATE